MLAEATLLKLHNLAEISTEEELLWMSGYLAGLAAKQLPGKLPTVGTGIPLESAPAAIETITIVYGTETGNAKKAATMATNSLKRAGIKTRLVASENYKPELLEKESFLVLVISTQGEGEPPATAKALMDHLAKRTNPLQHLQYGILALGSRSYPLFCQAGIDANNHLQRLRARPVVAMGTCDDDYESDAETWINQLITYLQNPVQAAPTGLVAVKKPAEGKKVFTATLGHKVLLNDSGSNKKVYHLEFDLADEIVYVPGNAVGVVPENDLAEVEKILKQLEIPGHYPVSYKEEHVAIGELLTKKLGLRYLPLAAVKKYAQLQGMDIPETRMDLYDLLRIYPLKSNSQIQELIDLLPGITPRIYTISSSPSTHPCQLHLTVELKEFETDKGATRGFGSDYITSLKTGSNVQLFLHSQKSFQIPPDDKDVIMIAQGTGIAPFRSFLAERETNGSTGRNWLLFGEENRVTDFYYQAEIQKWVDTGTLQLMHPAFQQKAGNPATLQEIVKQEEETIWEWLEDGAYLMISGEKEPTGKAVEATILQLVTNKLKGNEQKAGQYLKQLQKEGRFAKELY